MHCPGMFLPVINLLSKYDPVLQNLLENRTKKSVTYLSPNIQNEVINLLANSVQQELVNKINASSFYSIIIDSTQDISKVDQLSLIFRYVEIVHSNNVVTEIIINESFLGFVPVENQSADTISNKIISSLNNLNISINKLCGQGYDGAANMSGIYNGVQEKISKKVENAPLRGS
jgi:septum formation inhibitor-activating ATPase MinD